MSESSEKDLLVSFLDVEPPFVGGATLPELLLIARQYVLLNFMIGLIIGLLVGQFVFFIVGFFVIVVSSFSIWMTASWLKGHKRGKPPGYFMQWMLKKMTKHGLKKPSFIEYEGTWY